MRTRDGDQGEEMRARVRSQRWRDKFAAAHRTDRSAGVPAPTHTYARSREFHSLELYVQTSSDVKHCNDAYDVQ